MHVPSFFVGSLASGSAFLLVHQQLSHRERLSRKWPLAERAENELKARLKDLTGQIKSQKAALGVGDVPDVTKYYKDALDNVYNFFSKKD